MQVHLYQTDIIWEDTAANQESLLSDVERLTPRTGDLVVVPEMYSSGFSMDAKRIAEASDPAAPATATLLGIAGRYGCCVVGGVAVEAGREYFNESIAAFPDGKIARYRKHQGFSLGGEVQIYRGGETLTTFDWGGGVIGMTVCYDLRFPEIYRALAFAGAELVLNIANWPRRRIAHWVTLLRARAIENQCFVIGVNRVGEDPNSHYVGRSLVVDPHGEILADAGESAGWVSATIDFEMVRAWRDEFPALRDARRDELRVEHFASADP